MRKFRIFAFLIIIISVVVIFAMTNRNGTYQFNANTNADPILPKINKDDKIVKHSFYTLCYSEQYEEAKWVAYKLCAYMTEGHVKRKNNFRKDDAVNITSADPADYKNSGYDRGHLCPAADMKFSEEAMSETFFMSNISPQEPSFNRGIWNELEKDERKWAEENQELYITTGPVITEPYKTIGKNKVAVPKYFYKVILDLKEPEIKGIGFIIENTASSKPLQSYAVTIDSVESLTKIDFFQALPDSIEKIVESKIDLRKWFSN